MLALTGVGILRQPAGYAQEPVTVEIYFPIAIDSPISEILDGYAESYEAENSGVDIVFSFEGGYGDVRNKLLTVQEGGGDLPALAILLATDIYDLRNADAIQPLDDFANEDYLADFAETWLSNSYYDFDGDGTAELYSVPFQRSVVLLYYNNDLLAELGLQAPTTWEELATAAQTMTTDDRWGLWLPSSFPYWTFQPFAAGAGQNIVSESDTEVFFNAEAVVDALQYWIDLSQEYGGTPAGVQDNFGDAPGAFAEGSVGMIVHSSGSLRGILETAEFDVGVSAVPGRDGGMFTVTGGGNLYMVNGIDDATAEAAWAFVEWLTAPEQTVDWSIRGGYFNTRVSGFDLPEWQEYASANPQIADASAATASAVREFSVQSQNDVRNILHTYIQAALNGEESPQEALDAAQQESDEILSIFR
jgi:sn-glycerol 3-phosphate transport system substrate-binding protein